MKLYIAGSMYFAKQMLEAQEALRSMGHEAEIPVDTDACTTNPVLSEELAHCIENDVIRECMRIQERCDAVVVLNYPKHGVEGYIGANTLIEMGLAHYLGQKIFLLHPFDNKDRREYVEIHIMQPIVLHGDLKKIGEVRARAMEGSF